MSARKRSTLQRPWPEDGKPLAVWRPKWGRRSPNSLLAGNFPRFCDRSRGADRAQGPATSQVFPFSAASPREKSREFSSGVQGILERLAGNFSDLAGAAGGSRAKPPDMKDRTGPSSGAMETTPDTGHSRPPVHSRWKTQSGNPRGRRPKHPAVASDQPTSDPPAESKVGYGQPPRHSRWKPGQSGNPRGGRPRDILQEVLLSPFPVKIGARTEMVPALDVMLLRIRARALEGDQKVIRSLIEHFGSESFERTLVRRSAYQAVGVATSGASPARAPGVVPSSLLRRQEAQ